jgi:dihydroorotate dehydrogenase electron transfer subunit
MADMFKVNAPILSNRLIGGCFGHCVIRAPSIARFAHPGQCITIRISESCDPLLRRPFGVHRVFRDSVSILYQVVGKGTALLSAKKAGDSLDIVGPFGHGFEYEDNDSRVSRPVLIAGGMGVAPLVFLAQRLARKKPLVFIGASTASAVLCYPEFKALGCSVQVATDDGSRGFKGYISELLSRYLATSDERRATIYSCGPHKMLRAVSSVAKEYGIPAQVSLEAHMACGIGACLGCIVMTKDGYRRVCKDGPVFDARDIVWDKRYE